MQREGEEQFMLKSCNQRFFHTLWGFLKVWEGNVRVEWDKYVIDFQGAFGGESARMK